ncbi:DUF86 domain-containing protein [Propionispora sp. 2/2-37]|uniref:type VII toxin-antitoxin system HepT family RNase toxin n=1 Tax=Propionispora sp. 2/2-37 TaxID=1677858 RepID=UPI00155DCD1B|nr:DUF86 domain-containing protein [Propionispora sp. 2/2-37]
MAEYIQDLKDVQDVTAEEFMRNKQLRRYVERTLQVAIEACLDIGSHWIADQGWREPATYREIFVVLAENGVLTQEQAATYQKMAQFRNLLVHDYARIDPEILLSILKRNLTDLEFFLQRMEALLCNGDA